MPFYTSYVTRSTLVSYPATVTVPSTQLEVVPVRGWDVPVTEWGPWGPYTQMCPSFTEQVVPVTRVAYVDSSVTTVEPWTSFESHYVPEVDFWGRYW